MAKPSGTKTKRKTQEEKVMMDDPKKVQEFLGQATSKAVETMTVWADARSEEHTSELQSRLHLVCRLLLEKKKKKKSIAPEDTEELTWDVIPSNLDAML